MIDILQKHDENPDDYISKQGRQAVEEDKMKTDLKNKYMGQKL